jgi:hypothetical protein
VLPFHADALSPYLTCTEGRMPIRLSTLYAAF